MCLALYAGSDSPRPATEPWDADRPAFHAVPVVDPPPAVRAQLGSRFIVYLGSHEQCGCGFQVGVGSEGAERAAELENRKRLRDWLAAAAPVRLLVTWMDDEDEPLERRATVVPDSFLADEVDLSPHTLFEVVPSPAK